MRPIRPSLRAAWIATILIALLAMVASPPLVAAKAAVANGPIVFSRYVGGGFDSGEPHVTLINPDGSGERQVPLPWPADLASWSADGSYLVVTVFVEDSLRPAVVTPDGSSVKLLQVPDAPRDLALLCRTWSPDGELLLCQGDSFSAEHPESNGIYSIHSSDGSGLTRLTTDAFPPDFGARGTCGGGDYPGDYSPDGTRFVFLRTRCGSGPAPDQNQRGAIFEAASDGSSLTQLTPYGLPWSHPDGTPRWSPDGAQIVFGSAQGDLFTINGDGTQLKRIALDTGGGKSFAFAPDWSPDGQRLVFDLFLRSLGDLQVSTANRDGSDLVRVTQGEDTVGFASWGPGH
jgi:Tol biopolymer transport system component